MQDGVSAGKCLTFLNNIDIRWNSTFYMTSRYLELEKYVYRVLSKAEKRLDPLNVRELEILKDIVDLMAPFEEATKQFSVDDHPTASIVIPTINSLDKAIKKFVCLTKDGQNLQSIIIQETDRRFLEIEKNKNLAIATILDPRFKDESMFSNPLRFKDAIYTINSFLTKNTAKNNEPIQKNSKLKKNSIYHNLLISNSATNDTVIGSKHPELESYLYLQHFEVDFEKPYDGIDLWDSRLKTLYPNVYVIAKKYLGIAPSSVSCERVFSQAGFIKRDHQNRILPDHLDKLVFLSYLSWEDWN